MTIQMILSITLFAAALRIIDWAVRRLLMRRDMALRVAALNLSNNGYRSERDGGQSANDNGEQYKIDHRFISSYRD